MCPLGRDVILVLQIFYKCTLLYNIHVNLPNCLRIFPFYWLRQWVHDGWVQSAEDAHSSIGPHPTSYFCRSACLLYSCFLFFFDYCLLSTHSSLPYQVTAIQSILLKVYTYFWSWSDNTIFLEPKHAYVSCTHFNNLLHDFVMLVICHS